MDEEMEEQLNELVSGILQYYYNYLNLKPIDVEIVLGKKGRVMEKRCQFWHLFF